MLFKVKILADATRALGYTKSWRHSHKIAEYFATIFACILLLGCAGAQKQIQKTLASDPLSPQNLQQRTALITNTDQARQIEQQAIDRQKAADTALKQAQEICYRKFFVNRCLTQQAETRNQIWDQAQIDSSAARLYIRQAEAEQQRIELTQKVQTYQKQEAAKAAERARSVAEYNARQKAYQEKLAKAKAQEAADAAKRTQNVEDFNAKLKRIEEIKRKRIEQAEKAAAQAAQDGANAP